MKKHAFLMTWTPGVNSEFRDTLALLTEMGQQGESWFPVPSPYLPTPGSVLHCQGPHTPARTLQPTSPSSGSTPISQMATP